MARKVRPNQNSHRMGTLWIQPQQAAALDRLAETDGRTISDLVRDAIRAYVQSRTGA